MIRLIVFLAVAVALSLLATWLADNPGQVSLTWQDIQIETSFAVFVLALAVFVLLAIAAFELLRLLRRAPQRIGERRHRARESKGHTALERGLVAAAAGDSAAAKLLNRRAEKLLHHAPETLLLSAQAAQLDGDEGAARVKFQEMLRHPETEFLGLRGLLAQAMKDGDTEGALRLARRAYLKRPNTPWVLTTLFDLQTRAGLWTEALSTVNDMARYKLIDRGTAKRRRAVLFHQSAADTRAEGRPYEALRLAQKAHKLAPELAPLAIQASELAEQVSKPKLARKILETSWKARPHPALARAHLALSSSQPPIERFRQIERLHQMQPTALESELALAEQAIVAKQWQAARAALERAQKLGPTASVYRLLAELEQAEGNGEKARLWLARAVDAPPDPAWLCETTGEARADWAPFGPDGRFDSLRWGSPPKIVPLLRPGAAAELILPGAAPAGAVAASAPPGEAAARAASPPPAGAIATVAGPDAVHDTREASVARSASA
jgi:HemY protein